VSGAGRHLEWEGCFNVRDLGGLPTREGGAVRRGALIRADAVDRLSAAGWSALYAHGVRTVIDLRNDDEREPDRAQRPGDVTTLELPLDAVDESDFWKDWYDGPQFATPLYYRAHLERFPERSARVLAAIAAAPPGGVLVHCFGGRDRTGQIVVLALALAGVAARDIAADYELSSERLAARYAHHGEEDQGPLLEAFLAGRGTSASELIAATLAALDLEALLRAGGLSGSELAALRTRLRELSG
jgi:protein tyrosine/serine phosphatase